MVRCDIYVLFPGFRQFHIMGVDKASIVSCLPIITTLKCIWDLKTQEWMGQKTIK